MEQLIEFIGNHPFLVSLFIILVIALVVTEGKRGGQTISPQQASLMINREDATILDIRDRAEYESGHIVNSIHIPYASVKDRLSELSDYKEKPLVMICKMGQHSGMIGKQLKEAGFTQVYRIAGGMSEWKSSNFPLVTKKSTKANKSKNKSSKQNKNKNKAVA